MERFGPDNKSICINYEKLPAKYNLSCRSEMFDGQMWMQNLQTDIERIIEVHVHLIIVLAQSLYCPSVRFVSGLIVKCNKVGHNKVQF